MKICPKCNKNRKLTSFYTNKDGKLHYWCKTCCIDHVNSDEYRASRRSYYKKNKKHILERNKKYPKSKKRCRPVKKCNKCERIKVIGNITNQLCFNCYSKFRGVVPNNKKYHKNRSSKKGYRFNKGRFAAKTCGRPWRVSKLLYYDLLDAGCIYCPKSLDNEKGYSIDRVDNNRGYYNDNVVPCCGECNKHKSDSWSFEEMCVAMDAILEYRKIMENK